KAPTQNPTRKPTNQPTRAPTKQPSKSPTNDPTKNPTRKPTNQPTRAPTKQPSKNPTKMPTQNPTRNPTNRPTRTPTKQPSKNPTKEPTQNPTPNPTNRPTRRPTKQPSKNPTKEPTQNPTRNPTNRPTRTPTKQPTQNPTRNPTNRPTRRPNINPNPLPTEVSQCQHPGYRHWHQRSTPLCCPPLLHLPFQPRPVHLPRVRSQLRRQQFCQQSIHLLCKPGRFESFSACSLLLAELANTSFMTSLTFFASSFVSDTGSPPQSPSLVPTITPSFVDSDIPTKSRTEDPTRAPSLVPTITPSIVPTLNPTAEPSSMDTNPNSSIPTIMPSIVPTFVEPSSMDTDPTSSIPTIMPSVVPTFVEPSSMDTDPTSSIPTIMPSIVPTLAPSQAPTLTPSEIPTPSQNVTSYAPSPGSSILPTKSPNKADVKKEVGPTELPSTAPTVLTDVTSVEPSTSNVPTPLYILPSSPSTSSSPSSVSSDSPSIEPTVSKTVSPSLSNAPTPLSEPAFSPSSSASPSVQPSNLSTLIPTTEPVVSTPRPPLFPSSSIKPTQPSQPSSRPTVSTSPSVQPSPTGLDLPTSVSPSTTSTESPIGTIAPSPAITETSPPVGKSQVTDSPLPDMVNPAPASPDISCLSRKNDTLEIVSFDDDSVPASTCNDDADPYRTCIWRTTTLERCDRMVKNKPFVDGGETLIEGTIHLTISQNPVATNCKNIIQMEKALLTFLADNIGSSDTFEPACVYTVDSARDKQLSDGQSIETTAFKYNLMFIQKNNARRTFRTKSLQSDGGRSLDACSNTDTAMCCSQHAINGNIGSYCNSLGCGVNKCGVGRRPRKTSRNLQFTQNMRAAVAVERRADKSGKGSKSCDPSQDSLFELIGLEQPNPSDIRQPNIFNPDLGEPTVGEKPIINSCSFYGQLTGYDFNEVVRTYSEFKPEMSRSLLNVDDTLSVAVCSSNRFSIEMFGTPLLTCDEFENARCSENEDLLFETAKLIKKSPIQVPLNTEDLKNAENKNGDGLEFSANRVHNNAVTEEGDEYQNSGECVSAQNILLIVCFVLPYYGLVLQSLQ
ncbi:hypothetical protein ACHAW6_011081, partial [Cyclotella cf. meneghiniana]